MPTRFRRHFRAGRGAGWAVELKVCEGRRPWAFRVGLRPLRTFCCSASALAALPGLKYGILILEAQMIELCEKLTHAKKKSMQISLMYFMMLTVNLLQVRPRVIQVETFLNLEASTVLRVSFCLLWAQIKWGHPHPKTSQLTPARRTPADGFGSICSPRARAWSEGCLRVVALYVVFRMTEFCLPNGCHF